LSETYAIPVTGVSSLGQKATDWRWVQNLEDDLLGFQSTGYLPLTINMDSLTEGSGISNTLKTNFARWLSLTEQKERKLNKEVA
jgi:hypothetical protein